MVHSFSISLSSPSSDQPYPSSIQTEKSGLHGVSLLLALLRSFRLDSVFDSARGIYVIEDMACVNDNAFLAGGSNIPAVNDLLNVFDIAFGDALLEGQLTIADEKIYYASGVNIVRFPAHGYLHHYQMSDKSAAGDTLSGELPTGSRPCKGRKKVSTCEAQTTAISLQRSCLIA